jgi:hypothetical protein
MRLEPGWARSEPPAQPIELQLIDPHSQMVPSANMSNLIIVSHLVGISSEAHNKRHQGWGIYLKTTCMILKTLNHLVYNQKCTK